MRRERGLQIIIGYKLIKGSLWLVFAAILLVLMQMGIGDEILGVAEHVRHHSGAWSLQLADLLVRASTRRGLWTLFVALIADGVMTLVEAWALIRGHWWGPWLVVVATSSLLPFEIVALIHHPHVSRALLLAVNLVIVAYLIRKALREHRERVSQRASLPR
ncbi:MAG TPA: DUF2127 domain-containing protein [Polyangiaceae bacterium]